MSELAKICEINWQVFRLAEHALLLKNVEANFQDILKLSRNIEVAKINGIIEVFPAIDSICIYFDSSEISEEKLTNQLFYLGDSDSATSESHLFHILPVCYSKGKDLELVSDNLGLTTDEIIKLHTAEIYTVAMTGFLPGFLYLNGLKEKLHIPRKSTPDIRLPEGSVALGGTQTGIYSLPSPGGWYVIGLCPLPLFDDNTFPPMNIRPGDQVQFSSISADEFDEIKSRHATS